MTAANAGETSSSLAQVNGSGDMFNQIAKRYDLLNRIISCGLDQGWRRKTIASLNMQDGFRIMDLGTGTADLPIEIVRQCPGVSVVGVDPSVGMLDVGRTKMTRHNLDAKVELHEGDAQALQFEDNSFDGITMAFGIRNVPDREKALREMVRVLKPTRRIGILELSEPRTGFMAPFARLHIHHVVPLLGSLLSGSKEYRYLQRSIEAFPAPEAFAEMMSSAGFANVEFRKLAFGACVLYMAEVPA